jgi:hypothetical protein
MAEWHLEHMEKIIVKYVTGLSSNASMWEKKQHNRYGKISIIYRQIEYDIKRGVTIEHDLWRIAILCVLVFTIAFAKTPIISLT